MLSAASSPHPTPPHPRPEALPPPPGAQAPKLGGLRSFVWGWAQVLARFPGAVSGSGASGDPQPPPLRGGWAGCPPQPPGGIHRETFLSVGMPCGPVYENICETSFL